MSAQRLGRARKLLMLDGPHGRHWVSSSMWTKALGETETIRALISQCTKRIVPCTSSAQANCGLEFPNGCTLRFCAVAHLSIGPVDDVCRQHYKDILYNLGKERSPLRLHQPHERQTTMLAHQWRLLRSDAPIFEMSEEKKTHRKQYMECHHRYLSSYTAPTLDTTCSKKREQLLFHDLSTLPLNFFSTKRVAKSKESKAEGKWRRHSNWKKEARGTNLDISRLQANLAVLSMRGERKQKTKTNELSENDGHGIAGCLDLSNTAKIQAGVAGHQFHPECYCYSGRTASCYWVWTCNRTGAVRS